MHPAVPGLRRNLHRNAGVLSRQTHSTPASPSPCWKPVATCKSYDDERTPGPSEDGLFMLLSDLD